MGRGVNWKGFSVVVVGFGVCVVDLVVVVLVVLVFGVFVVVGLGPLVGTVGTSCVVLGGRGVVGGRGLSGLKPGGRRAEISSRITGTAGETRKPSIRSAGGGWVVTSSSGRLAA